MAQIFDKGDPEPKRTLTFHIVHPAGNAAVARRRSASGGGLRRALQQRPPEQRGWLRHAEGHARRASARDPRR